MNYIINPIWFYLIGLCSTMKFFFGICAAVCAAIFTVLFISFFDNPEEDLKKWIKKSIILTFCFSICLIFTPAKETCYQMMVANIATKENIEDATQITTDVVKEIVDYIDVKLNEE